MFAIQLNFFALLNVVVDSATPPNSTFSQVW
jgi:hypothetical protein